MLRHNPGGFSVATMQTTTHGAYSPERQEATPPDKSDAATTCAFCNANALGYDARTSAPSCNRCARLRADGGMTSETEGAPLSKFKLRILALLASHDDAPKGVTLKRELRSYYGRDVNHGQLYQNLNELVDDGYVAKGAKVKRTNAYSLTHEGREVLASEISWLLEQVPGFESGSAGEVNCGP